MPLAVGTTRAQHRFDLLVVGLVAGRDGAQLDVVTQMHRAVLPHEATARAGTVPASDAAGHEPEVGVDVAGQPPVVEGRLPVPRTPRMVA